MIQMPPPIPGSVGFQRDLDGGLVLLAPTFPQPDHRGVLARLDAVAQRLQLAMDMAQGAEALRARAAIALASLELGLARGEVGQVINELLELRVELACAAAVDGETVGLTLAADDEADAPLGAGANDNGG